MVIYLKTVPAHHPRVLLARLMKIFNDSLQNSIKGSKVPLIKKSRDNDLDDIIYLKTTPSHPRVRFARNSKIELEKAAKQAAAELRQ